MPLEQLESTLEPLLRAWDEESGPRRSFGDYVERIGEERVLALLGG
jgi:sulfite reductase (ferredoxin)